jgi:hypothetical protein
MDLQEAVRRSQHERLDFPDVINSSAGFIIVPEINVEGLPVWNPNRINRKRRVVLNIRTFRGISTNAIHFYGELNVEGVIARILDSEPVLMNSRFLNSSEEKLYPLLTYRYDFKITRPITQKEIDSGINRWGGYLKVGDLIEAFNSVQELISDAKEIMKLRFTGDWEYLIQYPRGNKEQLEL